MNGEAGVQQVVSDNVWSAIDEHGCRVDAMLAGVGLIVTW